MSIGWGYILFRSGFNYSFFIRINDFNNNNNNNNDKSQVAYIDIGYLYSRVMSQNEDWLIAFY